MDAGLRRQRHGLCHVAATSAPICDRHGDSDDRISSARELTDSNRDGNKYDGHKRGLEREQHSGRKPVLGNNYRRRGVHRTGRPVLASDRPSNRNKPSGLD